MYILYIHACTFPWKFAVLIKILRQSDKSDKSTRVNKNLGCSFMQHNLTKGLHPHTYHPFAVQGYTGHAANEWRSVSGGRSPQQQRDKVLRSNAKRISLMFSCMFCVGGSSCKLCFICVWFYFFSLLSPCFFCFMTSHGTCWEDHWSPNLSVYRHLFSVCLECPQLQISLLDFNVQHTCYVVAQHGDVTHVHWFFFFLFSSLFKISWCIL